MENQAHNQADANFVLEIINGTTSIPPIVAITFSHSTCSTSAAFASSLGAG
jgi:hypothetical protein